jgi:hypothetical protein
MRFSGADLRAILAGQHSTIDVRDGNGGPKMISVPVDLALKGIDIDKYFGVGSRVRIRYIAPITERCRLNAGSQTTKPVRSDGALGIRLVGQLLGSPRTLREFISTSRL